MRTNKTGRKIEHWIGIEQGWQEDKANPFERLVAITPEELRTHALVIGATGSGKTNLLHHLVAQDIRLGNSFVILDLRGDFVDAALDMGAGYLDPRKTFLLDLRERKRPSGFNPLSGLGEPYFRALAVLDAVAAESESWGVQLSETLRNALMLLAESREPLTRLESLFLTRRTLPFSSIASRKVPSPPFGCGSRSYPERRRRAWPCR